MIEALKKEGIIERVGGRFRFCALAQRRLVEFLDGARPLVERGDRSDLELAIAEIEQGKIAPVSAAEAAEFTDREPRPTLGAASPAPPGL